MWGAAIALGRRFLPYILVAVAVAGYTGGVYWAGGRPARAALQLERVEHKAVADRLIADQQRQKEASDADKAKLEKEHQAEVAQVHDDWSTYVDVLCPGGITSDGLCRRPGGGAAAKPVRITTDVCDDPGANQRLSDTVSLYRDEVRSALAAERSAHRSILATERAETAGLLETAQLQAGALAKTQVWVRDELLIHTLDAPAVLK